MNVTEDEQKLLDIISATTSVLIIATDLIARLDPDNINLANFRETARLNLEGVDKHKND